MRFKVSWPSGEFGHLKPTPRVVVGHSFGGNLAFIPVKVSSKINVMEALVQDGLSKDVAQEDLQRIHVAEEQAAEGGGVELHVLEDNGHWVQADNPDGLFRILLFSFEGF